MTNTTPKVEVERNIVFTEKNVEIKIDQNAVVKQHDGADYFVCRKAVKGGFFEIYVFGATEADRGKKIAVDFELKTKKSGDDLINYGRGEKISTDPNVRLTIAETQAGMTCLCNHRKCTSTIKYRETTRQITFHVGFTKIQ